VKIRKLVIAVVLILAAVSAAASNTSPPVTVDTGALTGVVDGDVVVYRGIPYAAPPVGELRWRPPHPVAPWKGLRTFEEFGPACRRNIGFGPVVDGTVVPADIGVLFGRGEQHDVPFLLGANSYEGSLTAAFGITPQMVFALAGRDADTLRAAYAPDGIADEKMEIFDERYERRVGVGE